jgi:hypothetical protein
MVKEHGSSCGFDIVWSDFQGLSLIGKVELMYQIIDQVFRNNRLLISD